MGVIRKGEIILVEEKVELMRSSARSSSPCTCAEPVGTLPDSLARQRPASRRGRAQPDLTYETRGERTGITGLLGDLADAGITFTDLDTSQSSLEDIFVDLVRERA